MIHPRAWFATQQSTAHTLVIADVGDHRRAPTVTNDVEAVVRALHDRHALGARRLFYYDSAGDLDEIVHDGGGRFLGFRVADATEVR